MSAVNGLHCFTTSNLVLFPTNVVECGYIAGAHKIAGAGDCQLPEHSLDKEVRHLLFVFLGNLLCKKLVDAVLSKRKELLTINISSLKSVFCNILCCTKNKS